jgi:hypothetical protein
MFNSIGAIRGHREIFISANVILLQGGRDAFRDCREGISHKPIFYRSLHAISGSLGFSLKVRGISLTIPSPQPREATVSKRNRTP